MNEQVVKELGWSDPLNERLMTDDSSHAMSVIGVMKNFNIESFPSKIKPLVIGLASFTAEQRSKEIGIRKVMGASVTSLNVLLSKDLFILISISFVIASVFAWYAMDQWLGTFPYRFP